MLLQCLVRTRECVEGLQGDYERRVEEAELLQGRPARVQEELKSVPTTIPLVSEGPDRVEFQDEEVLEDVEEMGRA